VDKPSILLVSARSLQFASWHDSLSVSCWPPVLPDGCDLNLLNGVKKLLDPAKSLFTHFQLKSAKSSEILVKSLLFLRWLKESYTVKQYINFRLALALSEHGLKMPVLATRLFGSQYTFIQYFEQRNCSFPRFARHTVLDDLFQMVACFYTVEQCSAINNLSISSTLHLSECFL